MVEWARKDGVMVPGKKHSLQMTGIGGAGSGYAKSQSKLDNTY